MSKECVLIGGLPCSGKTTLAKKDYPNHFLIDDPSEFWSDVEPHLIESHVVITCPYLSFKESREQAKTILESFGFSVTTVVLDEPKSVLLERAEKRDGKPCQDFITNFDVEL